MAFSRSARTGDPERDLAYEREFGDVPEEVVQYLQYFKRMLDEKNVPEIQGLYECFSELTDRFYSEKPWPDEKVVESIVGGDARLFIILYKELYYRDLYTRSSRGPALWHRYDSYMNYQDLFSEILNHKNEQRNVPVDLDLPNVWLWDIIDEFVYQFQAFCLYKANPAKRTPEEIDELHDIEENGNAWNIYPVLNILYSLLEKSQVNEQLKAIKDNRDPDEVADDFGRHSLYFRLGYFSLIGLLRLHVLLADYHQALRTVEFLEMDTKGLYTSVPSCLVTLHYYLFHLLAICLVLQPTRIDESIQSQLLEKSGDRMLRMANGDLDEFRNAFQQGCPKFLSPNLVVYEGSNQAKEPLVRQCNSFLEGIESQIYGPILRGYLKLYTTLPLKKLASFMDISDAAMDTFVGKLLTYKMIVNELGKETRDRSEVDDSTLDLDFYIDKDMIVVADTKVARRVGEYFINQIKKLQEVTLKVKSSMPIQPAA